MNETPPPPPIPPIAPVSTALPASTPSAAASGPFSLDVLFSNPVFAGGFGLASLGALAAIARKSVVRGADLLKRRLLVDIEIPKNDAAYPMILAWLSLPRQHTEFLTKRLTRIHHLSMSTMHHGSKAGNVGGGHTSFSLQPGYGRHIIRQGNAYIAVSRERKATVATQSGEPFETITLTTLYAHRNVFESIFLEAHALSRRAQEGKIVIYTQQGMSWGPFGEPRRKRPLESVVLDKGIKERILADVKDFLGRQEWYVDRGIPYRRGYLLYGPPGSGKSSFIQSLAGELGFGVAIINLSERGMTDDKLSLLMTKLPSRSILLLEDADAAFVNRRVADPDGYTGNTVTFSGLLNALDGVAAGEERITFLTTNHIERLDSALVRPGRVDMTVKIGEATRYQAAKMWERFYGDRDQDGKAQAKFLKKLEELRIIEVEGTQREGMLNRTSTAAIQGLFLFNKDDMEGAIAMAEGLIPRDYEAEMEAEKSGSTT